MANDSEGTQATNIEFGGRTNRGDIPPQEPRFGTWEMGEVQELPDDDDWLRAYVMPGLNRVLSGQVNLGATGPT